MPTWVTVLLAILALPVLGTLVTVTYQHFATGHSRQEELRREGAAVVAPIQETLTRLSSWAASHGPELQALDAWPEQRERLRVYAHAHPDNQVRVTTGRLMFAMDVVVYRANAYRKAASARKSVASLHERRKQARQLQIKSSPSGHRCQRALESDPRRASLRIVGSERLSDPAAEGARSRPVQPTDPTRLRRVKPGGIRPWNGPGTSPAAAIPGSPRSARVRKTLPLQEFSSARGALGVGRFRRLPQW